MILYELTYASHTTLLWVLGFLPGISVKIVVELTGGLLHGIKQAKLCMSLLPRFSLLRPLFGHGLPVCGSRMPFLRVGATE